MASIKKILVANRSEIATRVFRSATELGIRTVAIYTHEDRYALHRFKADEAYQIGQPGEPIRAYLDIPAIIRIARQQSVDAIHPGYGFLSEKAEFAEACAAAGITFVGPSIDALRQLGDKTAARRIAKQVGVPILAGTEEPLADAAAGEKIARQLGSPDLLATFLDTTGQVYLAMQDYARAEEYFQQAMDLYQGIGNDPNEITLNLARAALGQGRLEEAAERLQHSLEPLEARGVNRFSYQFHELLSRIYELQGDFSRAVWHYKRFHAIQSQVFGEETQHRLGNLAVLHQVETARLDAEILRLKNLALHQEISASRQALAEMQVKATTDALTGMLNRRHFMTLASYLFDASRQSGKPLAALMMDIDHFKNVNDAFGHHAGDQVLAEISAVIQANLRSGDLLGRYGGEEFVAVLPDSHLSEAYQVAQRVLEKVAGHSTCCGALSIQITLSIGTAQSDAADASLESLLKRADLALYAAKRLGKNRVI